MYIVQGLIDVVSVGDRTNLGRLSDQDTLYGIWFTSAGLPASTNGSLSEKQKFVAIDTRGFKI